jgi:hypothetical protein
MARNSRSDGSDPAYVQMEAFARVRQRKMDAIHQENMVSIDVLRELVGRLTEHGRGFVDYAGNLETD